MDDVRNVPAYLKLETAFACAFGGFIFGFIFPPLWLLSAVGIVLFFARLFWEMKHPLTKEQKEQLKKNKLKLLKNFNKQETNTRKQQQEL